MNSELYQQILKENVRTAVHELKLKRMWVMKQDNDPKHTSRSTRERRIKLMFWNGRVKVLT